MSLIRNGELETDDWVYVSDDEELPRQGGIIVSASRWESEKQSLKVRPTPVGVRLNADMTLNGIAGDLPSIDLVALAFPMFTDGRAYSAARTLREKYGYKGEIRAVGNVLRDQLAFMTRCGFDSFEVGDAITPAILQNAISEIDTCYQPASDAGIPAYRLRHG